MLPAGAYVTLEHEYILIVRKGPKREFKTEDERINRRESALCSGKKAKHLVFRRLDGY